MQLIQAWFNNTTFWFLWTALVNPHKLLFEAIGWVNSVTTTKKNRREEEKGLQSSKMWSTEQPKVTGRAQPSYIYEAIPFNAYLYRDVHDVR